jgi:predicted phage baseplate assembly protein
MTLPAPELDDRRFQGLVDEAKRYLQQRCPQWTDHNVSDPGITLLELFAWMTDQLVFRLNRVPDRNYVKFLELIGVRLAPPAAATTGLTFVLAGRLAPNESITLPAGLQVASPRSHTDTPIVFTTTGEREIFGCERTRLLTSRADGTISDHTEIIRLSDPEPFVCFSDVPQPGDALLIGLSRAVPSCAIAVRVDVMEASGAGVTRNPPLRWQAWSEHGWINCDVEADPSLGLNRPARDDMEMDILLHVPDDHVVGTPDPQLPIGAWLRAVVIDSDESSRYTRSPRLRRLDVYTRGATVTGRHCARVSDELCGLSNGRPGQRFTVRHAPLIADMPVDVVVNDGRNGQTGNAGSWTTLADDGMPFASNSAEDAVVAVNRAGGEIVFAPQVRLPDGQLRRYGAVPSDGAEIRASYWTGGGDIGNVRAHTLTVLRTPIDRIARVDNRYPASGGRDAETLDDAKVRGPLVLRTQYRAVTGEDYQDLAMEVARARGLRVARVRCVADMAPPDQGVARVLIVPTAEVGQRDDGTRPFSALAVTEDVVQMIEEYLAPRRAIGARVVVEPAFYQRIRVVARVAARAGWDLDALAREAQRQLASYLDPLVGGRSGRGWEFGDDLYVADLTTRLQAIDGIDFVLETHIFRVVTHAAANPEIEDVGMRLTLGATDLIHVDRVDVAIDAAQGEDRP